MEHTELKKETSIDWLMTQLYKKGFIKETDGNEPIILMNKAKELQKQHIIDAANLDKRHYDNAEQYYDETFNK
jgi:hypothetical protein